MYSYMYNMRHSGAVQTKTKEIIKYEGLFIQYKCESNKNKN